MNFNFGRNTSQMSQMVDDTLKTHKLNPVRDSTDMEIILAKLENITKSNNELCVCVKLVCEDIETLTKKIEQLEVINKESVRKDYDIKSLRDELREMSKYIQELLRSLLSKVANGVEHAIETPKVVEKPTSKAVEDYIKRKNNNALPLP